ncbi:hypothetical protein ABZ714_15120 [Streptomyces sp. NPDC006798]|uniref:hypothetical protein n=1 Tax=Streptomyces sp. NPDC006798 TaxID=3155462 RepID=UPI0033C258DF
MRSPRVPLLIAAATLLSLTLGTAAAPATPTAPAPPETGPPRTRAVHVDVLGPTVSIPPGSFANSFAECPASAPHVVGGGNRSAESASALRLTMTHPAASGGSPTPHQGWEIEAVNTDPVNAHSVTAYAVCSADPVVQRFSPGLVVSPGVAGVVAASCLPDEAVTGGGMSLGVLPGSSGPAAYIQFSTPKADGWQTGALNRDTVGSRIRAVAICSPKPHSISIDSSFTVLPPGQSGSAIAICPAGRVPSGGGTADAVLRGVFLYVSTGGLTPNGWEVHAINTTSQPQNLRAAVVCTAP